MIEVIEVKTKKEIKEFINFPIRLYKNNPYYVPALYGDELKMFKPNYVYYDQSEAKCFIARKDGKTVGRIQAIIQKVSNQKHNEKKIRFTRFDSIDDQEVSDALFNKVTEYAKNNNLDSIVGPLGFSDLEREGLLIEGFDQTQTFEEQYNYSYYQKLIENYGFEKEVDWTESIIKNPQDQKVQDKILKLAETVLKRNKLHIGKAKNVKDFLNKYADQFFEILDETYEDIYGTVPFTDGMKKLLISNFQLLIDLRFVCVILDENEKCVSMGLCLPSISEAVRKSNGHLTLPAIFRILKAKRNPKIIDFALIGVKPSYQMKGVNVIILAEIMKMLNNKGISYAETNLNLETNQEVLAQWKYFDANTNKRRRCFIKKI